MSLTGILTGGLIPGAPMATPSLFGPGTTNPPTTTASTFPMPTGGLIPSTTAPTFPAPTGGLPSAFGPTYPPTTGPAHASAPNPAPAPVPLPPPKFPTEKFSSNQTILKELQICLSSDKMRDKDVNNILNHKIVLDKLRQGLGYYDTKKTENTSSLYDAIEKVDYNSWTENKVRISNLIKNQVVSLFVQQSNLPVKVSFELIDLYFVSSKGRLFLFTELENKIKEQEAILKGPHQYLQQEVLKKYELYRKELSNHVKLIVKEVTEFYMKERQALLKLFELVITNALCYKEPSSMMINTSPNRLQSIQKALLDFLQSKLLENIKLNMITWLIRNLTWNKEFTDYELSKSLLGNLLQKEQVEVLKLIFALYSRYQPQDKKEIDLFQTQYLQRTNVQISNDPFRVGSELNKEFVDRKTLIEGLGQLTCICQLQIHKMDKSNEKIKGFFDDKLFKSITDKDFLNNISAPVYLAIFRMLPGKATEEETKSFYEQIETKMPIYHLNQLLQSDLFQLDNFINFRDQFYIVLKSWLNLIYGYLDTNYQEGKKNEKDEAEKMAIMLLKNRQIINEVCYHLDVDNQGQIKPAQSLYVFQHILNDPTKNLNKFLELSEALCNKTHCKQIFELLNRLRVGDSSILNALFDFVMDMLDKIHAQTIAQDNLDDFYAFSSALKLVCKMIKQDPKMFSLLDYQYREYKEDNQIRQGVPQDLPQDLLTLLFQALFQLLQSTNFEFSRLTVAHIINSLCSIFENNVDQQPAIIDLFERFRPSSQDLCIIIHFFNEQILNKEAELNEFKVTQVFLKLLCKIFKKTNPLDCLQNGKLETSFLQQSLQHVYVPLMKHYFSLKFRNAHALGSLTGRLLKLGRILFAKFSEIPNKQKQMLYEPLPQNDQLLETLADILNSVSLQKISTVALNLVECEHTVNFDKFGFCAVLENKFLREALVIGQSGKKQRKKIQKMILEALKNLNAMVTLSQNVIQQEEGKVRSLSKKAYFITYKLNCVQNFRQQILDPSIADQPTITSQSGASLTQTLFSQVAHYVTPSQFLDASEMKVLALNFLTNCCILWEDQLSPLRRPELESLLSDNLTPLGKLREKFSSKFIKVMEEHSPKGGFRDKKTLVALLDFLCVTANSQPRFIEMCFMNKSSPSGEGVNHKDLCDSIVTLLNKTESYLEQCDDWSLIELIKMIRLKFVILFSILAKKNICLDLLEFQNHEIIKAIHKNIIGKQWFKSMILEDQQIDGKLLRPVIHNFDQEDAIDIEEENHHKVLQVTSACHAKIALCYYVQLISSQWHRKKYQSDDMGRLVNLLFESLSGEFSRITPKNRFKDFKTLSFQVEAANNWLKSDSSPKDQQIRQQAHASKNELILSQQVSTNGSIHFENIMQTDLFKSLQERPSMMLMMEGEVSADCEQFNQKMSYVPGNLGTELFFSTAELSYCMTTPITHYDDYCMRAQCTQIFKEFNLALSQNYTDMLIQISKREFMVKIGHSALTSWQGQNVDGEQLARESLLPLVLSIKQIRGTNSDSLKEDTRSLIRKLIHMAQCLLTEDLANLSKKDQMFSDNSSESQISSIYLQRMNQISFNNFSFIMGAINTLLGPGTENQKQLETLIIDYLIPDLVTMFVDVDSSKKNDDYDYFTQIVLQSFQILKKLQPQKKKTQEWLTQIQKLEIPVNQILSKVIEGMRNKMNLDNNLKIIQVVITTPNLLLESAQIDRFMKKQDSLPLRVLIEMLTQSTNAESHEICQLFIEYACEEAGAKHLDSMQILRIIHQSECLKFISEQSLYGHDSTSTTQLQVRNPNHTLWLQILLLFRTLNQSLVGDKEYQNSTFDLMKILYFRFKEVLEVGINLNKTGTDSQFSRASQGVISIALLEEIELITCLFVQLFPYSQQWCERDPGSYCNFKDLLMFAVPHLVGNLDVTSVLSSSCVEEHLGQVTQERLTGRCNDIQFDMFSALQLKLTLSIAKIHFNMVFALHSLLTMSDQDLIITWNRSSSYLMQEPQGFYEKVYSIVHNKKDLPIKVAYELMLKAQNKMSDAIQFFGNAKNKSSQVCSYLINLFTNNELVQKEYPSGLNLTVLSPLDEQSNDMLQLQEMTLCAISAGEQVCCILLEKVRTALGDILQQPDMYYGHVEGSLGGSQKFFAGMGNKHIEGSAEQLERSINEKKVNQAFTKDKDFLAELTKYVTSVRYDQRSSSRLSGQPKGYYH